MGVEEGHTVHTKLYFWAIGVPEIQSLWSCRGTKERFTRVSTLCTGYFTSQIHNLLCTPCTYVGMNHKTSNAPHICMYTGTHEHG